jgi:hypothetical protein
MDALLLLITTAVMRYAGHHFETQWFGTVAMSR